jgi:O-acetylhomoserine (thiol)-lyase
MFTQPDSSYGGVVWSDAVKNAAYIIRTRTILLRDMGACISPFNSFQIFRALNAHQDGAPLRQCHGCGKVP